MSDKVADALRERLQVRWAAYANLALPDAHAKCRDSGCWVQTLMFTDVWKTRGFPFVKALLQLRMQCPAHSDREIVTVLLYRVLRFYSKRVQCQMLADPECMQLLGGRRLFMLATWTALQQLYSTEHADVLIANAPAKMLQTGLLKAILRRDSRWTARLAAVPRARMRLAQLIKLLRKNCDSNEFFLSPLIDATPHARDPLAAVVDPFDIGACRGGNTALAIAAAYCNMEATQALLQRGCFSRNHERVASPLTACMSKLYQLPNGDVIYVSDAIVPSVKLDVMYLLLSYGASPWVFDECTMPRTPLLQIVRETFTIDNFDFAHYAELRRTMLRYTCSWTQEKTQFHMLPPAMQTRIRTLLLANARLRRKKRAYLIPDLLRMVLERLFYAELGKQVKKQLKPCIPVIEDEMLGYIYERTARWTAPELPKWRDLRPEQQNTYYIASTIDTLFLRYVDYTNACRRHMPDVIGTLHISQRLPNGQKNTAAIKLANLPKYPLSYFVGDSPENGHSVTYISLADFRTAASEQYPRTVPQYAIRFNLWYDCQTQTWKFRNFNGLLEPVSCVDSDDSGAYTLLDTTMIRTTTTFRMGLVREHPSMIFTLESHIGNSAQTAEANDGAIPPSPKRLKLDK